MNELIRLGYIYIEEKDNYIEFRTKKNIPFERIKIMKKTLEVYRDCKTIQGNKGHRSISYNELKAINKIVEKINKGE